MMRNSRTRRFGRPLLWLISAGFACECSPLTIAPVASAQQVAPDTASATWMDALKDTARSGRPTLVLVTSGALQSSVDWCYQVRTRLAAHYGESLNIAELRAESDPQRVRSLNVKSIPTVLVYRNDGKGGLVLGGYREGASSEADLCDLLERNAGIASRALIDQAAATGARRTIRVQRASVTTGAPNAQAQAAQQPATNATQDAQVAATTHQYAQSSAQSSPQNYAYETPNKQMPPAPVKTPPNTPAPPPTTYQAPPPQQQPVYSAPPAQTTQPVYAYVPQQPVYAAPPSATPVMVSPPAGQVVVQPAPLNVTVAPSPPPQVTYMAPAMAPAPMMAPAMGMPAMAPAPNAFTASPPMQPAMGPPASAPEPALGAPQPSFGMAPQPGYGAGPAMGYGPQPAAGLGSMAMGMMLTNPNILDRMLGGLGRLLAERSYPRIRMNPESPSLFAAPAGMGGFVGINPAMAMAPSTANPLQTYMAVPNGGGGGGGDATEAYLKAYIALCKEKGITPNLPGWEPPAPSPPTGPVPSPQGAPEKKRGWFFH